PYAEYLESSPIGYRLVEGRYEPIAPINGRLPSEVAGLHLERDGKLLRLHDPATGRWVPWTFELGQIAERAQVQAREAQQVAAEALREAEAARREAEEDRRRLEEILRELEALRRRPAGGSGEA